jgi:hypothetical protein
MEDTRPQYACGGPRLCYNRAVNFASMTDGPLCGDQNK